MEPIDYVIVRNRYGIETEVTREHAMKMVKNLDIKEKDIYETKSITPVIKEVDAELEAQYLIVLQNEYKEKLGKELPARYRNDIEWIKSKLI